MDASVTAPVRQVRAHFDATSIVVYQAFGDAIADAALATGRFVAPFSMERMSWIKPSFLWMMYRCGWATKPGQERVLAIRISRAGFEAALSESCLSHFDPTVHADEASWRRDLEASPVRIQWDPERTLDGKPLPHRSLQVGLSGAALRHYVAEWIQDIEEITGTLERRRLGLDPIPDERPYPLPAPIAARIAATH
jgi:hypothetical protein